MSCGLWTSVAVTHKDILDTLFGRQAGCVQGEFIKYGWLNVGVADAVTALSASVCDDLLGAPGGADDLIVVNQRILGDLMILAVAAMEVAADC